MVVIDPADARPNHDDASRRRRRKVVGAGLAILVVAGLSVGLWQWRSVNVFGSQGNTIGIYVEPGETLLVLAALPEPEEGTPSTITVHAVEPQVIEGTVPVEVLVCHRHPDESSGIGSVRGELIDQYCGAHGPAVGARVDDGDRLIYRFRPDEPSRVAIEGIKVSYSHGWRRGSQVTGPTVESRPLPTAATEG